MDTFVLDKVHRLENRGFAVQLRIGDQALDRFTEHPASLICAIAISNPRCMSMPCSEPPSDRSINRPILSAGRSTGSGGSGGSAIPDPPFHMPTPGSSSG